MIYIAPGGNEPNAVKALSKFDCARFGIKCRVVNDIKLFFEKLEIFDAGLDDRVIELLKVHTMCEVIDNSDTEVESIRYQNSEGNKKHLIMTLANGKYAYAEIDKGIYNEFKRVFVDTLADDSEFIINLDWARDRILNKDKDEIDTNFNKSNTINKKSKAKMKLIWLCIIVIAVFLLIYCCVGF